MSAKFRKQDRILRTEDFNQVHDRGEYSADDLLVVKAKFNSLPGTRLGLSVSRQVGNAVLRNRWKRAIREAFRLNRAEIPLGIDLVVRPRKGAQLDVARISHSLIQLSKRVHKRLRRRDQ